jgi:transposase
MQMSQKELPLGIEKQPFQKKSTSIPSGQMRLCKPVRNQIEMILRDLNSLVSEDHAVRTIWEFLEKLDLSAFYSSIKVALDVPGRPASDPQVLLALWIYATVEGVGSARRLDKLCQEHDAYKWLCGGVPVNYHTLADFRMTHQEALEKLLTEIIATMMHQKLVTLKRVAQDGTRVRADAGAGSFHRGEGLERCLTEAEEQVKRLAEEREHPDPEVSLREQSARERAARERKERMQAALSELQLVQAAKEKQKRTRSKKERSKVTEARVSTTDPEVRVMKMSDGGYRPAYNVQMATDVESGVIVGAAVINQGNDSGQGEIMESQVAQRAGIHPEAYLMDGSYAQRDSITTLTRRHITVYAPVRPPRTETSGRDRNSPRSDDNKEVIAWRKRMETEEAKIIYRLRAAIAEWANARVRCHGLVRFTVRGLSKVLNVVLLTVIAHNLLRWQALAS